MSEPQAERLPLTELFESIRNSAEAARGDDAVDPLTLLRSAQEQMESLSTAIDALYEGTYEGFSGEPLEEGEDEPADRDHRVTAVVNGRGSLQRIEIGPYAMRDMDAAELSHACTEAVAAAGAAVAHHLTDGLTELTGVDPNATETPEPVDIKEAWRKAKQEAGWNG